MNSKNNQTVFLIVATEGMRGERANVLTIMIQVN